MARKREHVALEYEVADPRPLHAVARLPASTDNVAICCGRLEGGTPIVYEGRRFTLAHTMMEGHRFAHRSIKKGEALLSWDLPFGYALRNIDPGEYICNAAILDALKLRHLDFALPNEPNFYDEIRPWRVDEATFQPGVELPRLGERYFDGFPRSGSRGVGTRNFIVIMGTSSRTSSLARAIEKDVHRLVDLTQFPNIDGVVAAAHTEGGDEVTPNNRELVLRTLAGFAIHPNVGALLLCDAGTEPTNNAALLEWIEQHKAEGYDLSAVPHALLALSGDFTADVAKGSSTVRAWLDGVNACKREKTSAKHLKIALQCGGSDAFSGISGNPLAAAVSKIAIEHGGIAQMAETDELIGAEKYFISSVRDLNTAQKFLDQVERFKERAFIHGHSAEGNPSGGNKFRGLYNIVLKSCGAAMKRNPDVRLDFAIDYSELMPHRGFYFMDSPGNDLESIAGQVASGCNVIYFITGNGSITNFPFVPTIKIVTTTGRFKLLEKDMDVNAGRYLDGESMDSLARETYDLTLRVCGGERSAGERAGHAQVQIWRNWALTKATDLALLKGAGTARMSGVPVPLSACVALPSALSALQWQGLPTAHDTARVSEHIALVLPTSLCSGQIALQIAQHLNAQREREGPSGVLSHVSRFVALPHTEGCGVSSGDSEELFKRTLVGYLLQPIVRVALLLEHGCEKTHNNFFAEELLHEGVDTQRFGWASIQLDGGIASTSAKVTEFFCKQLASLPALSRLPASLADVRIALLATHGLQAPADAHFRDIVAAVVSAGGSVVVPHNQASVLQVLGLNLTPPTIAYAQRPSVNGLHVMAVPTTHWIELLTGLGATGVELFLVYTASHPPPQTNPFVPSLHVGNEAATSPDIDFVIHPHSTSIDTMRTTLRYLSRQVLPRLFERNADFQITRGYLGISL